MEKELVPGGWTPYSTPLSAEAQKVFDSVIKGLMGVHYTPLAFATQPVEGINYRFFCNAKGTYPFALNEAVIIQIYQPIKGETLITSIHKVD
jgi:hypothetical protein